jgi:hypothetical protein
MSEQMTEQTEHMYHAIGNASKQSRGVMCLEEFTDGKIVRINYLSTF